MISNILGTITLIVMIIFIFSYGLEMTVYGLLSILESMNLRKNNKERETAEIALEKIYPKMEDYLKIPVILIIVTLFFFVIGL